MEMANYRSMPKTDLAQKAKSGDNARKTAATKRSDLKATMDEALGVALVAGGIGYGKAKGVVKAKYFTKQDGTGGVETELIAAGVGLLGYMKGRGRTKRVAKGMLFGGAALFLNQKAAEMAA